MIVRIHGNAHAVAMSYTPVTGSKIEMEVVDVARQVGYWYSGNDQVDVVELGIEVLFKTRC